MYINSYIYFILFWLFFCGWLAMIYKIICFEWRPIPIPSQWSSRAFMDRLSGVIYLTPVLVVFSLLLLIAFIVKQPWRALLEKMLICGLPMGFLKGSNSFLSSLGISLIYFLILHVLGWLVRRFTFFYILRWANTLGGRVEDGRGLVGLYYYVGTLHFIQGGALYAHISKLMGGDILLLTAILLVYAAYAQLRWSYMGHLGVAALGAEGKHQDLLGTAWNPFYWMGLFWMILLLGSKLAQGGVLFSLCVVLQAAAWGVIFSAQGYHMIRRWERYSAQLLHL